MKNCSALRIVSAFVTCVAFLPAVTLADWWTFRGPSAQGVSRVYSDPGAPPLVWDKSRNIAWKAKLPGRGLSSPIVVDQRIVVTANSGFRQDRLHVLCFAPESGEKLWERQFWATGMTYCHPKTSMAAPSPTSDGSRIFALYSCNDLACLDLDGNLLWTRALMLDYPNAANSVGLSASPLVVGDTLVVQIENDAVSFAAGLDTTTGANRWKVDRPRGVNWTSPVQLGSNTVILQSGGSGLSAFQARSGKSLWQYEAGCHEIASTTVSADKLFVPADGVTVLSVPGKASSPVEVWKQNKLKVDIPSPIVHGDRVYAVGGSILRCADAGGGEIHWRLRLTGPHSSSPVAAGGHLYVFNDAGVCEVVEPGETEGKVVSANELGEAILCTPAVSDGALYVRSDAHLWKIAR